MTTYGYVWRDKIMLMDEDCPYDCSSLESFTNAILARSRPMWEQHFAELEQDRKLLEPYVDKSVNMVQYSSTKAIQTFLTKIDPGDRVLLTGYDVISEHKHRQVEVLRDAHQQGKLLVSLKETALLKLDIDVALELQQQWVIEPLAQSVAREADATYIKLKELMLEGYTGDKIAELMGMSRSTIFRLRRDFHDRLVDEVPGYGKSAR